jgi:hypothetical protein
MITLSVALPPCLAGLTIIFATQTHCFSTTCLTLTVDFLDMVGSSSCFWSLPLWRPLSIHVTLTAPSLRGMGLYEPSCLDMVCPSPCLFIATEWHPLLNHVTLTIASLSATHGSSTTRSRFTWRHGIVFVLVSDIEPTSTTDSCYPNYCFLDTHGSSMTR